MRHAYLVMAHNEGAILRELLRDLDDERNDVFVHVDAKACDIEDADLLCSVSRAALWLLPRRDVRWGDYSQIECLQELLASALAAGPHACYHFISGTEFPLKSQDYIHSFIAKNPGKEFVGFCDDGGTSLWRISLYHPFARFARPQNGLETFLDFVRRAIVKCEKLVGVNRLKDSGLDVRKGNVSWSIDQRLAEYLVEAIPAHRRMFDHSYCADELVVQTLVFNSDFAADVYDLGDEYRSAMRIVNWGGVSWLQTEAASKQGSSAGSLSLDNLDALLISDRLFGRKFSGEEGLRLIDELRVRRA